MGFSMGWRRIASAELVSVCVLIGNVSFGQGYKAVEEKEIVWYDGSSPVSVAKDTETDLVVGTAIDMFVSDIEAVTGKAAVITLPKEAVIRLVQLDRATEEQRGSLNMAGVPVDELEGLTDGFNITIDGKRILVTGSNGRGAAYGLLELSRLAGVSPWIWWGDVVPQHLDRLTLPENYSDTQGASVEYRGVFLNDEDWSLRQWSANTFEPENPMGPRTYKEILKLLMRLRANAVWPAMHPGTTAFFKNPENKLVADSCGIAVGSSHCEPLLRNNVDEWDRKERGDFNYITNREAVQDYWIDRLFEVKDSEGGNLFTIGMRGIHDGSMEGVKTNDEKLAALQQVIDDQQELFAGYVGDPKGVVQVFVPYKEVLELYEGGLKVPDYVTLMWCDDNYGYITRLSTPEERLRSGGAGVYYHLSYWGRPHDYLWLSTTQPGLIYNEMRNAYDHDARKLWIANVHDPKVAAYNLELFLDMAWNINSVDGENLGNHLRDWLIVNYGETAGERLYPVMRKFYNLTAKRRPEFMGWSQTELNRKTFNRGLSPVANTDFSFTEFGGEADRYMAEFLELVAHVEKISGDIHPDLKDAYFAAVIYPVKCAAYHVVKMLEAQRARVLAAESSDEDDIFNATAKSQKAYQNIRALTNYYNEEMGGGKWRGSMNMNPRTLPAGSAPLLPWLLTDAEVDEWLAKAPDSKSYDYDDDGVIAKSAVDFSTVDGMYQIIDMLGHSGRSIELAKGASVTYRFLVADTIKVPILTTALVPTQPNGPGNMKYAVSVDGAIPTEFDLKETFRSEQWKQNVLRNQTLRHLSLPTLLPGEHTLTLTALDSHIVFDQWLIDPIQSRKFYMIPATAE